MIDHAGWGAVALVALGGLLYTLGAAAYALKRPDPWPATFGYHEVFHALVVVAALCHYVAIAVYVLD
jgi:hemolysin III